MNDVLAIALVVAIFGVVLGGLPWLAFRVRRRTAGGGYSLMGPFDEVWHPAALQARIEIEVQDERPVPAPVPGDTVI
jgi:hypothetical protein